MLAEIFELPVGFAVGVAGVFALQTDFFLLFYGLGKMESVKGLRIGAVLLVVIVVGLFVVWDNSREVKEAESELKKAGLGVGEDVESVENKSNAHVLAELDEGGYVPYVDPSIEEFQALLDSLNGKTVNTEQEVADISVKGRDMLAERGVRLSLHEFMSGIDETIPSSAQNDKVEYEGATAKYIQTRA